MKVYKYIFVLLISTLVHPQLVHASSGEGVIIYYFNIYLFSISSVVFLLFLFTKPLPKSFLPTYFFIWLIVLPLIHIVTFNILISVGIQFNHMNIILFIVGCVLLQTIVWYFLLYNLKKHK